MKLGEQFKKEVATVPPDARIRKAAFLMRDRGVGAVVVVNAKNKPVGIVTDRDLAFAVAVDEKDPDAPVSEIMPGELITIGENEGIFNATQYIMGYQVRRLPIVNTDGKLVGIVTMDALIAKRLRRHLFPRSKQCLSKLWNALKRSASDQPVKFSPPEKRIRAALSRTSGPKTCTRSKRSLTS